MNDRIDEVLAFWFGAEDDPAFGRFRPEWFEVDPVFDSEIRRRFLATYEAAREGKLDQWRSDPRGVLALVIVLDQFARNLFRGSPRSYEMDARARSIADEALEQGVDQRLPDVQRLFLYMPFMHSENLPDQDRSVALFQAEGEAAETQFQHALEHRDVIRRFGRFPYRNETLGRENTPEEIAFLAELERSS